MNEVKFDIQGAIFLDQKRESKSGKEYISGVLETRAGQEFNLYCYMRESKAGKKYISLIGNKKKDLPDQDEIDVSKMPL